MNFYKYDLVNISDHEKRIAQYTLLYEHNLVQL